MKNKLSKVVSVCLVLMINATSFIMPETSYAASNKIQSDTIVSAKSDQQNTQLSLHKNSDNVKEPEGKPANLPKPSSEDKNDNLQVGDIEEKNALVNKDTNNKKVPEQANPKNLIKPAEKNNNSQAVTPDKKRVIVKYKSSVKNLNEGRKTIKDKLGLKDLDPKKEIKNKNIHVYEFNESDNIQEIIKQVNNNNEVEYVQEDKELMLLSGPAEPEFYRQWGLYNEGQDIGGQKGVNNIDINILKAWEKTQGSSEVVVGVIDSGIDINHTDLKDNIYTNNAEIPGNGIDDDGNSYIDDIHGWDFANDDNSVFDSVENSIHGTHVAGIISALENGKGILGVSPKVKILPVKFIEGDVGYTSDVIESIEYCKSLGISIINCSWGSPEENQALKDAMSDSQILFICAAGNNGLDSSHSPVYPSAFNLPNIISVAALDNTGKIASFSNYGSNVDIAAPGVNILSTMPGNEYGMMSGTSMAAPMVSGVAALLKSYEPDISISEMADRIKRNAAVSSKLNGKLSTSGYVDAEAVITNTVPTPDNAQDIAPPVPIAFDYNHENTSQNDLSVSEKSNLTLSIPGIQANAGDTIDVPVNIQDLPFEGICNMDFTVDYDKNVFSYIGFSPGKLINKAKSEISVSDTRNGLKVLYLDISKQFNCPLTGTGEIIRLKFKINSNISNSGYYVGFSNEWSAGKVSADGNLEELPDINFIPGFITIGNYNMASLESTYQPKSSSVSSVVFEYGDLNGDRKINSTDFALLQRHLLGNKLLEDKFLSAADVNNDGKVNSTDYTLLKRRIQSIIDIFPADIKVNRSVDMPSNSWFTFSPDITDIYTMRLRRNNNSNERIVIHSFGSWNDICVYVYDSSYKLIASNDDYANNNYFYVEFNTEAEKDYYIVSKMVTDFRDISIPFPDLEIFSTYHEIWYYNQFCIDSTDNASPPTERNVENNESYLVDLVAEFFGEFVDTEEDWKYNVECPQRVSLNGISHKFTSINDPCRFVISWRYGYKLMRRMIVDRDMFLDKFKIESVPSSKDPNSSISPAKKGHKDEYPDGNIERIQTVLKKLQCWPYVIGTTSRFYGDLTEFYVAKFQEEYMGVRGTGIVDSNTARELSKYYDLYVSGSAEKDYSIIKNYGVRVIDYLNRYYGITSIKFDLENKKVIADGKIFGVDSLVYIPAINAYYAKITDLDEAFEAFENNNSYPLKWPTFSSQITLNYGQIDEFYKAEHSGIDVQGMLGDKVISSVNGQVVFAGYKKDYGNVVFINSIYEGRNIQTRYGHLDDINVVEGEYVSARKVIGHVGSTGNTYNGNVLHLEVLESTDGNPCNTDGSNTKRKNPLEYFKIVSTGSAYYMSNPFSVGRISNQDTFTLDGVQKGYGVSSVQESVYSDSGMKVLNSSGQHYLENANYVFNLDSSGNKLPYGEAYLRKTVEMYAREEEGIAIIDDNTLLWDSQLSCAVVSLNSKKRLYFTKDNIPGITINGDNYVLAKKVENGRIIINTEDFHNYFYADQITNIDIEKAYLMLEELITLDTCSMAGRGYSEGYIQDMLYIEYLLLQNPVVKENTKVNDYLLTSLKNGKPLSAINLKSELRFTNKRVKEKFDALDWEEDKVVYNLLIDFLPTFGDGKGLGEAIVGYDALGNKLAWWERALNCICLSELRHLAKAGEYYDIVKSAKNANEVLKAMDISIDATKKIENLLNKDIESVWEYVTETADAGSSIKFKTIDGVEAYIPKSRLTEVELTCLRDGCFTGDTLVTTKHGFKRIDEIHEGEYVLAKDVNTGIIDYKEVLNVYKKTSTEFVHLNTGDGIIYTTPSHLFFTDSGWWVSAKHLKAGDKIATSSGEMKALDSVEFETTSEPVRIYNLNVDEFHTYFVGTSGLLVHNDCTLDMMVAGREAIENARLRGITDSGMLSDLGTATADFVNRFSITDANEISRVAEEAAEAMHTRVYRGVDILDNTGKPLGELDWIDVPNKSFIEAKSAQGLNTINPTTGLPYQTAEQWAQTQIYTKTTKRINNLKIAVASRATKDGTAVVPALNEFTDFKKFIFKMDADTPELRAAVQNAMNQLKNDFPDYVFSATFGG